MYSTKSFAGGMRVRERSRLQVSKVWDRAGLCVEGAGTRRGSFGTETEGGGRSQRWEEGRLDGGGPDGSFLIRWRELRCDGDVAESSSLQALARGDRLDGCAGRFMYLIHYISLRHRRNAALNP